MRKSIFKNFFSLVAGEIISGTLGFVAVIYLARVLGPSGLGRIGFALAIVSYFLLIPNAGLSIFGTKKIARDKKQAPKYINNIVSLRLILALVAFIGLLIFVFFIPKSPDIKKLILLYGLTVFTFSLTLDWVFQGLERMYFIALGNIIKQVIFISGVFLLIKYPDQILRVPLIQVMAALGMVLFLFSRMNFPKLQLGPWKKILKQSWPMGASLIFIAVYHNLDKVMLGFMNSEQSVGFYEAAYRIVSIVLILPGIIFKSFFPALSRSKKMFKKYFFSMIPLGVVIGLFGIFFSPFFISILYGSEYNSAVLVLRILFLNVMIIFLNMALGNPLLAWGKQTKYMKIIAVGAGANLVFNFLLIPKYSLVGAAIATVLAEIVVLLGFIVYYFNYGSKKIRLLNSRVRT